MYGIARIRIIIAKQTPNNVKRSLFEDTQCRASRCDFLC